MAGCDRLLDLTTPFFLLIGVTVSSGCAVRDSHTPRNGEVRLELRDGDRFEGVLRGGRRDGQGTYLWASGDSYIGEWIDDRMSGNGTLKFANGERYVGEFLDGRRNGYGVYSWPDGRKASGFWDNDILIKPD